MRASRPHAPRRPPDGGSAAGALRVPPLSAPRGTPSELPPVAAAAALSTAPTRVHGSHRRAGAGAASAGVCFTAVNLVSHPRSKGFLPRATSLSVCRSVSLCNT